MLYSVFLENFSSRPGRGGYVFLITLYNYLEEIKHPSGLSFLHKISAIRLLLIDLERRYSKFMQYGVVWIILSYNTTTVIYSLQTKMRNYVRTNKWNDLNRNTRDCDTRTTKIIISNTKRNVMLILCVDELIAIA